MKERSVLVAGYESVVRRLINPGTNLNCATGQIKTIVANQLGNLLVGTGRIAEETHKFNMVRIGQEKHLRAQTVGSTAPTRLKK